MYKNGVDLIIKVFFFFFNLMEVTKHMVLKRVSFFVLIHALKNLFIYVCATIRILHVAAFSIRGIINFITFRVGNPVGDFTICNIY